MGAVSDEGPDVAVVRIGRGRAGGGWRRRESHKAKNLDSITRDERDVGEMVVAIERGMGRSGGMIEEPWFE